MPNSAALYHNIKIDKNGEPYIDTKFPNKKYVNYLGQEAVFNKETGEWIKDGINDATYNIAGTDETLKGKYENIAYHLLDDNSDVNLWIRYGTSNKDILTSEQRKEINEVGTAYYINSVFRYYATIRGRVDNNIYQEYLKIGVGE